jgi:hypothetical protein
MLQKRSYFRLPPVWLRTQPNSQGHIGAENLKKNILVTAADGAWADRA